VRERSGVFDFAEGEGLPEHEVPAARMAAARLLLGQVQQVGASLKETGGELTPVVASSLALARTAISAIERPILQLGDYCPRDGTPVVYDRSKQEYCCARRCCPP